MIFPAHDSEIIKSFESVPQIKFIVFKKWGNKI